MRGGYTEGGGTEMEKGVLSCIARRSRCASGGDISELWGEDGPF